MSVLKYKDSTGIHSVGVPKDVYSKAQTDTLLQKKADLDSNGKVSNSQLPDIGYSFGDIRTTLSQNLGDNWLPCDGSTFNRNEYPQLADAIGKHFTFFEAEGDKLYNNAPNNTRVFDDFILVNGTYYNAQTRGAYVYIYYSNSISGPWTTKQIGTYNGSQGLQFNAMAYHNGTFVICCSTQTSGIGSLAFVTNDPLGEWTMKQMNSGQYPYAIGNLVYGNGYWVLACYSDTATYRAGVMYATDPLGTWTYKDISDNNVATHANGALLSFYKGKFIYMCNSKSNAKIIQVFTASNPSGEWVSTNSFTQEINYFRLCNAFEKNGDLIIATRGNLLKLNSPDGKLSVIPNTSLAFEKVPSGYSLEVLANSGEDYIAFFTQTNKKIAYIMTTNDLSGEWSNPIELEFDFALMSSSFTPSYASMIYENDCVLMIARVYSQGVRILYSDKDIFKLPLIQSNNYYTYVKAK